MADTSESTTKGDFTRRLAQKALMPIVATAASAAAGYAAKKGPHLFEEKVLPKLKQTASGAGDAAEDLPARAKEAVSTVGDLAGRAKEALPVVGSTGNAGNSGSSGRSRRGGSLSRTELERHVRQRADARAARRKTTTKR